MSLCEPQFPQMKPGQVLLKIVYVVQKSVLSALQRSRSSGAQLYPVWTQETSCMIHMDTTIVLARAIKRHGICTYPYMYFKSLQGGSYLLSRQLCERSCYTISFRERWQERNRCRPKFFPIWQRRKWKEKTKQGGGRLMRIKTVLQFEAQSLEKYIINCWLFLLKCCPHFIGMVQGSLLTTEKSNQNVRCLWATFSEDPHSCQWFSVYSIPVWLKTLTATSAAQWGKPFHVPLTLKLIAFFLWLLLLYTHTYVYAQILWIRLSESIFVACIWL